MVSAQTTSNVCKPWASLYSPLEGGCLLTGDSSFVGPWASSIDNWVSETLSNIRCKRLANHLLRPRHDGGDARFTVGVVHLGNTRRALRSVIEGDLFSRKEIELAVGPRTCLLISSLSTHGSLGGCGPHASPAETASQANVFEPPVWPAWTAPDVRLQSGLPFSARGRLHASASTPSGFSGYRVRPFCASAHWPDQLWAQAMEHPRVSPSKDQWQSLVCESSSPVWRASVLSRSCSVDGRTSQAPRPPH
jgi:hypothetical protein